MKKFLILIISVILIPVLATAGTGQFGLIFNGTSDYVSVNYSGQLNPNYMTIEANVKLTSIPIGWSVISLMGDFDDFAFYIYNDGTYPNSLWFDVNTATGYRSVGANDLVLTDQWLHLVGTYDGNTGKLFVDGVESVTEYFGTSTEPITTGIYNISFGARGNDPAIPDYFLDGIIDNVKFYNRALTPAEVIQTYNGTNITNGLIGNWAFETGTGSVAIDSVNGNNGTIVGANWIDLTDNSIIQINNSVVGNVLGYAGRLFTDLKLFIILAIGLPLGFYVIKKAIGLVTKRIK